MDYQPEAELMRVQLRDTNPYKSVSASCTDLNCLTALSYQRDMLKRLQTCTDLENFIEEEKTRIAKLTEIFKK